MSEQLEIPVGTALPESNANPNPQGFPTFGDLPESGPVGLGPRITFAEDEEPVVASPQEGEPVTAPAPETASPPAPENSPPPVVAPTGVGSGQELFQSMVWYDQYKEAKKAQEEQARASKDWQPPTIPDDVAEEILTNPAKLKAFMSERDRWHREAAVSTVQPIAQKLQQTEQALNTLVQRQHEIAWNDVRDAMQARGVNADAYYGPIMQSLQQNPNTYMSIATDARALKSAVEYLHVNSGQTFSSAPQAPKAPLSAGTSAAAPNKNDTNSNYTHPAIEQAERVFGKKFNKQMREEFRRGINEGRV